MADLEPTCKGSGGTSSIRVLRAIVLGTSGIALMIAALNVMLWLSRSKSPRPSPPDLSRCTRIEIRQFPIALGYPVWRSGAEKDLLTPEEVKHIETLLRYVVEGPDHVRMFARMIAMGSYYGVQAGTVSTKLGAVFLCHFSDRPPMRLTAYGANSLVTEDKQVFHYKTPLDVFARIRSQVTSSELLPQVRLRIRCARNLAYLYAGLRGFEGSPAYPFVSTWCDTVVKRHRRQGDTEKAAAKHVVCPSAYKGICHYAMNPDCEPNCPPETVLLFEAKSGWNRHGGPELFTFDNHDPRGGCVLLNDGTVKFIRTEDELHTLRWE